jgi:hypothetical protein
MNANALHDLAAIRALGATQEVPLLPLPDELLPVAPFPLAALPQAFRPWVTYVSERMHCPPDFVAVPLLVAASSLVARRVAIRPQRHTDWTERANLWALIVGRPGYMKSPAMAQALAPIERLEARAAARFNDLSAAHRVKQLVAQLRADENLKAAPDQQDASAIPGIGS